MKITEHDKEQIRLIDSQVKMLQDKSASDEVILNTLIEFVPDTKCLVENAEPKALELQLGAYNGFAYFVSIISLSMTV
jgi:hypothetical protein